jgi:ribosomal protein S18 acetylase RimI-like enzyme
MKARVCFHAVESAQQVAEVARLARDIWREHYTRIIGPAQVEYMLQRFQSEPAIARQLEEGYEYYLVAHHGKNAGYVAVVPDAEASRLMVSKIYVEKSRRGHGLGKQALEFVESLGRRRGIRTLWLTVNRNNLLSIAWYERMGFMNVGPVVQDIGGGYIMDDFKMEKPIPAS